MRHTLLRSSLVALSLAAWSGLAGAVSAGEPAPDFKLPGLRESVQLSALAGKWVYLDFWASWCGPCKQSFPWMNDLHDRLGAQGLYVIAINVDTSRDAADRFLADTPARFTVAFDSRGATPRSYEIKGMPTSVLIGPDGKVLFVHSGFRDAQRAMIEAQITQALSRSTKGGAGK